MHISIPLYTNETELINACIRQENWAQKYVYETYYTYLLSICLRYASNREEARDWLQDGFIKIFLQIEKYQKGTSLKNWLYRVMVNDCIDHIRKARRSKIDPEFLSMYDEDSDWGVLDILAVEEIVNSIQQLSATYRAVFNMYVMEGYSHKEIAETLQISEATSRSNLVKARNQLKKLLAKKYPNE